MRSATRVVVSLLLLLVLTGTSRAQAPVWFKSFDGTESVYVSDVAVDPSDNTYITGSFVGTVNFGGANLAASGNSDVFLAKFDSAGNHVWSKRFGGSDTQVGLAVATGVGGSVVITGYIYGSINFGGGTLTSAGSSDAFLAIFDFDGNHVFSARYGDASAQMGLDVALERFGGVVMTGQFQGSIDFGGGALTSAGANDIFVARFGGAGSYQYGKRFGDVGDDAGNSVSVDAGFNAYITGIVTTSADFGGGALVSAGSSDAFLVKLDISGNHVWSKLFGDAQAQAGRAVCVDPLGYVVVTGQFASTIDLGGGALPSTGPTDIFLAKFNAAGLYQWSKRLGGGGNDEGNHVAVDVSGFVFLAGFFDFNIILGGPKFNVGLPGQAYVVKFDPLGVHRWSRAYGGYCYQSVGLAVDSNRDVILGGEYDGHLYLGVPSSTSNGTDGYLSKLASATATAVGDHTPVVPAAISSYPNPFNPQTTIRYQLPTDGVATVVVHDARGAHVATLVDARQLAAGEHTVSWKGTDDKGDAVVSGVYFVSLRFKDETQSTKLVLLK